MDVTCLGWQKRRIVLLGPRSHEEHKRSAVRKARETSIKNWYQKLLVSTWWNGSSTCDRQLPSRVTIRAWNIGWQRAVELAGCGREGYRSELLECGETAARQFDSPS